MTLNETFRSPKAVMNREVPPSGLDSLILGRKVLEEAVHVVRKKSNMSKRHTAEFKRDAVALVYSSGKTVTDVAREIGVSPEGLWNWVKGHQPIGRCVEVEGLANAHVQLLRDAIEIVLNEWLTLVPLGRYWRSRRLAFSFVLRCEGRRRTRRGGSRGDVLVADQFHSAIPGQGLAGCSRQAAHLLGQSRGDRGCVTAVGLEDREDRPRTAS
ncbi:transposase [Streptomyces violascens]|uniref:transposase n=1 Tax=Streptomyces violascens TaxID=67381 RepID=UPI00364779DA